MPPAEDEAEIGTVDCADISARLIKSGCSAQSEWANEQLQLHFLLKGEEIEMESIDWMTSRHWKSQCSTSTCREKSH